MNCCDEYGNCRQGRDCPARAPKAAKVAKVKRSVRREIAPVPVTHWRGNVKHLAKWMLLCIAAMFLAAVIVGVLHA